MNLINSHNLKYFIKKRQFHHKLDFYCACFTNFEKFPNFQNTISRLPKNSAVIFREYNLNKTKRQELALKIQKICKKYQHKFIVAKDLQLALKLKADGIHFSDHDKVSKTKKIKNLITTLSCHNLKNIKMSKNFDFLFFSPVFLTSSHPELPAKGILQLKKAINSTSKPIFALGGIKNKNINKVTHYCSGIGGIEIFEENR